MLLLLIRHGETDFTNKSLVGRSPGVHLNQAGRAQAEGLVSRLEGVPLNAIYSSPLERAMETAAPLAQARSLTVKLDPGLSEVDYGAWTGRRLLDVRKTEMWKEVMLRPEAVRFPDGEALWETQARVVGSLEAIETRHRAGSTIAVFSHGDAIRSALCQLIGMHLSLLHRLALNTASVSAVWLGRGQPRLLRLGDSGSLADLAVKRKI